MCKLLKGNLLDVKAGVIIHQVNNKGAMGAGIAGEIRRAYPQHYLDFKAAEPLLGTLVKTKVSSTLGVVGMFSQDGYGRDNKVYTNYGAFEECLKAIAELYAINPKIKYYVPFGIGCGLAGGDWNVIISLLEKHTPFMNIVCLEQKEEPKKEEVIIDYTNAVSFTGHRPDKFAWKYDEKDERCVALKARLRQVIEDCILKGYTHFITGMALGVDTWAAEICLGLKVKYPITVEAAIPCQGHSSKWIKSSIVHYNALLSKMDKVTLVTDKPYSPALMQVRNQYMVDHSKLQVAVWDGSQGGTYNAVSYAKTKEKFIIVLNPNDLTLRVHKPNK